MSNADLIRVVATPYCQIVMFEEWNPARGRFFVDYRARHGQAAVIGTGVIDEFRTISAPIFIAPASIIGGVYDAGMLLADHRDVEAPIDLGWPPLTIGVDVAAPALPPAWKAEVLDAIQSGNSVGGFKLWQSRLRTFNVDASTVQVLQCKVAGKPAVTIIVTNAAMLPQQLGRLADTDSAPMTVAVSTGNRLPYVEAGELHAANAVSESTLQTLLKAIQK